MKNLWAKTTAFLAALSLSLLTAPAFAGGGTYDSITTAVDWSEVSTALVAIGALIAAVLVVKRGARMILSMIGR